MNILGEMIFAPDARQAIHKVCLLGTLVEVPERILGWAVPAAPYTTPSDPNMASISYSSDSCILWVCGRSGSRKSTIARSVAARLEEIGRLGSFYAFDNTRRTTLNPNTLFSTLARHLADRDVISTNRLLEVIKDNTALRKSSNTVEQFEKLILTPSFEL